MCSTTPVTGEGRILQDETMNILYAYKKNGEKKEKEHDLHTCQL